MWMKLLKFPIVPAEINHFLYHVETANRSGLVLTLNRIFTVEKLDNNMLQESIPLSYTPRRFVKHPEQPLFYVIEIDQIIEDQQACSWLFSHQLMLKDP